MPRPKKGPPTGGAQGVPKSGDPLPCLLPHNCKETPPNHTPKSPQNPSSNHHQNNPSKSSRSKAGKAITVIELTVEAAAARHGLERLGFLTLTFRDHVLDKREAQRRFHSLRSWVIAPRYDNRYMVVWERQKSGRLHAHLLVVLPFDARRGVDFAAFKRGDYRSAPIDLRNEWAFWRKTAPAYGFGRTELLPIRTTAGAMGNYVGKYLGKDLARDDDARARRYGVGKGLSVANQAHQSIHSGHWRQAMGIFAQELARVIDCRHDWEAITERLGGGGWVYRYREDIAAVCDAHRRSPEAARAIAARIVRSSNRIATIRPKR